MNRSKKISLVIITLNEESNIQKCIESAKWVDEVIVVDSGSTDRTCEIAQKLGAKVVVNEFKGFRDQKQFATHLATHSWVLNLDADEAVSPELAQEIQNLDFTNFNAFLLPRLSFHMGKWIQHGGWYPDYQLRLFNKESCEWGGGHVHEKVISKSSQKLNLKKLKNPLHHWVFKDLTHQVSANNNYSGLGALDLYSNKKKFSLLKLIFKPISKFLETYFWKKGFLDGLPGFIIAVGAAYSVFLKFSKLYELEKGLFKNIK